VRDLLLFLLTAWAATASGRAALRCLRLPGDMTLLERNLFGLALGLGLLGAEMLALGLARGLYRPAGFAAVALLLAAGLGQHGLMAAEARDWVGRVRLTGRGAALAAAFGAFALVPLVGCFAPPTLLEWDSLAYHLADPKLYLQAHRIYYLPWEDHSNFGFTAEMWYLYGLLLDGPGGGGLGGVPLAKLFHWACGAGTCLSVYALGARFLAPAAGKAGALLFASTPLVFWEAGTAYVDLATGFFTTLTLLALGQGVARRDERWLRLGAVLMGLTLTTKATALGTLSLLCVGLLLWRLRVLKQAPLAAIRSTLPWTLTALAVGSPWFIKSAVLTGNPVYPFFYGVFGGRGWDQAAADFYTNWNAGFGMGHGLSDVALAPWNLVMFLLPGHPTAYPKPFNDYQTEFGSLSPVLLAALFFPAFARGASGAARILAAFALGAVLLWVATMQYVRYLLPALPALCLLSGYVLTQTVRGRCKSGYALAALGVCSLAFSLLLAGLLVRQEAPVVFGRVPRDRYIARGFGPYPAMQFINTRLPADAKVVFYGSPLGFYCDRPYVWGDAMHGTYIPYDSFHNAEDLRAYLHKLGVTHVLIWERYFPPAPQADSYPGWVYQLTAGAGPPVFSARGVGVWAVPALPGAGILGASAHSSSPAQDAALLGAETGGSNPRWATRLTKNPESVIMAKGVSDAPTSGHPHRCAEPKSSVPSGRPRAAPKPCGSCSRRG